MQFPGELLCNKNIVIHFKEMLNPKLALELHSKSGESFICLTAPPPVCSHTEGKGLRAPSRLETSKRPH